jgi:ferrochelatase
LIAKFISSRRTPVAYEIYGKIHGGSPILKNTQAQAHALENILNNAAPGPYKCFIAMRYWHPFAEQTAREVASFGPEEIILLPLYPQFSTTTTESSVADWKKVAHTAALRAPTKIICCYPQQPGFIRALAEGVRRAYEQTKKYGKPRVLFSAHGLPEKIIKDGDPYKIQCEMTVEALRRELNIENLDSLLCFQSRVGPLPWIKPATDDEVRRAGRDKVPLVVAPIAFTSDHSETLVEIDIEYRHLAEQSGVPFFAFVPAVGTAPDFIAGLAQMVRDVQAQEKTCVSATGARLCPAPSQCLCANN